MGVDGAESDIACAVVAGLHDRRNESTEVVPPTAILMSSSTGSPSPVHFIFKPFSLLLEEPALKESVFAGVRNKMAEYVKDVEKFRQDTPLVLFCQAVPYMERQPPPGLQTLVTEHQWPETATLGDVEGFKESFLGVFGLPECAMMMDGIRRGSFKVTWFVLLPATVVQLLKGSKGLFRDFKVTSVKIDGEYQTICRWSI